MFVIDIAERKVRRVIDVAPHRGPHEMAEDPSGLLWVTCDDSAEVIVVDPEMPFACSYRYGGDASRS